MFTKLEKNSLPIRQKWVEIKSFLNDAEKKELKIAPVANSVDGLGEKLPEESNYWWPFGYNSDETLPNKSIFKELPKAKLGFSIASSLFDLKEGDRTVNITIHFQNKFTQKLKDLKDEDIKDTIKVLCSGEKEWLSGVEEFKCVRLDENGRAVSTPLQQPGFRSLSFVLPKNFPAVVNYNKKGIIRKFPDQFTNYTIYN